MAIFLRGSCSGNARNRGGDKREVTKGRDRIPGRRYCGLILYSVSIIGLYVDSASMAMAADLYWTCDDGFEWDFAPSVTSCWATTPGDVGSVVVPTVVDNVHLIQSGVTDISVRYVDPGTSHANTLNIDATGTGSISLNVLEESLSVTNDLNVGNSCVGTLTVEDGGWVTNTFAYVGRSTCGSGNALITGVNVGAGDNVNRSSWENSGWLLGSAPALLGWVRPRARPDARI